MKHKISWSDLDLARARSLNTLSEVGYKSQTVNMRQRQRFLPEEVSTQADHCILGGVQTYVALKSAVLVATVGRSRAARSGTWVFSGRGRARGWRGGGGGHLQIDPLNRKVQVG